MSFLTLIHLGGGSTVEAADAREVLGPYDTLDKAEDAGDAVYNRLASIDNYFRDECFFTVVEIPDPPVTNLEQGIQDILSRSGYSWATTSSNSSSQEPA